MHSTLPRASASDVETCSSVQTNCSSLRMPSPDSGGLRGSELRSYFSRRYLASTDKPYLQSADSQLETAYRESRRPAQRSVRARRHPVPFCHRRTAVRRSGGLAGLAAASLPRARPPAHAPSGLPGLAARSRSPLSRSEPMTRGAISTCAASPSCSTGCVRCRCPRTASPSTSSKRPIRPPRPSTTHATITSITS